MITYQDYEKARDKAQFLSEAITKHMGSAEYRMAVTADAYDRQRNVTIYQAASLFERVASARTEERRIASNFFNRLNTQRCSYLLGNGVSFAHKEPRVNAEGIVVQADLTKERLGPRFDTDLYWWGYKALIHGVAFGFWNYDRLLVFPLTEFAPLWDEDDGSLRAGVRFWRLAHDRPVRAEFYEADGYSVYKSPAGAVGWQLECVQPKRGYIREVQRTEAGEVVAEAWRNYPGLPVIPMWGSSLKQSTLVGLRDNIDSYDLVKSGFANDLAECAQIYWLIQNAGGMTDEDMRKFLRDLREKRIAKVDTYGFDGDVRGALSPYVQDVPFQGRTAYLEQTRKSIYEDFGALDVHVIAAGTTNDHIDAAYQPMDEQADLFEFQVIEAVQGVLRLMGIDDVPQFKRNRIGNVKEQIEAVMLEANYLDHETVLRLLPNITVDMVPEILARLDVEAARRMPMSDVDDDDGDDEGGDGES